MGLLNIFRSTTREDASVNREASGKYSLSEYDCYYLYGLTDNPFRQSRDLNAFNTLYSRVIGDKGGIMIGSSFHPYQLVNPKGISVWQAAYVQVQLSDRNGEAFNAIKYERAQFMSDLSDVFKDMHIWKDSRLTAKENPVFGKYVPFVIPFLVHRSKGETTWNNNILEELAIYGDASRYVESVTAAIRFMMPVPAFVIGLDVFDESDPSALIHNFVELKKAYNLI